MLCRDVMRNEVEPARKGQSLDEVARRMRDAQTGFLPVCDEVGRVIGVVTDRDIAVRACAERLPVASTGVDRIMTRSVISCSAEDPLARVGELMAQHQRSRIVITDGDGRLLGVVSMTDLAQYEEPLQLARILRQVSSREFRFRRAGGPPA